MASEVVGGYRLGRSLGEGATAVVHVGERLADGAKVAVKVLHPDLVEHDEMMARFRREARTLRELSHPHIVGFVDFVEEPPHALFVMELLDGGTMEKYLSLKGSLTEGQCLTWVIQLADGLAAAHDRGVVHRDIKPANIFLTTSNKVVLSDFGLARPEGDNLTRAGTKMIGTPLYMAPEQILGRTAFPSTDVYQVGICLHEFLTGHRPFPSSNDYDRMMARIDTPLELPADTAVSEGMREVVRRCGGCSPEDRYAHASELYADLVALAEGRELTPFGDEAITLVGPSTSHPGAPAPATDDEWRDPDAYEGTLLVCPQVGMRYDPGGQPFFVGSDPRADVTLESREIAPRQIRIKPAGEGWEIETGNFQAEALVDGERLAAGSRPLAHGSMITLAGYELLWVHHPPAAGGGQAPAPSAGDALAPGAPPSGAGVPAGASGRGGCLPVLLLLVFLLLSVRG